MPPSYATTTYSYAISPTADWRRSPARRKSKSEPHFSADGKLLSFRIDNEWFVHDLAGGVTAPAAIVKAEKDPNAPPAADDLREMQLRTFATLKKLHDDKEAARIENEAMQKGDASRPVLPFYLGEDVTIRGSELSPDARWLLVVTEPKSHAKGREGQLTRYVTESGYEEFEKERLRVGRNPPAPQSLLLLNLADHSVHALSLENLPGIYDDPLKSVREENAKAHPPKGPPPAAASPAASGSDKKARGVWVINDEPDAVSGGIIWSADGGALGVEMYAIDHKDRWIASVDLTKFTLVPQHRLNDAAWIDRSFNEFGWLNDNRTLWYESEESGYAHLYTKALNGAPRALTQGQFEVSSPQLSEDGRWFYVLSNETAPYSYDVYRVPSGGGALQRLTKLEGVERAEVDRSGKQLLLTYSTPYMRTQIAVAKADGSGTPRELTDTRTPEYKAMTWIQPEIVKVPSTHFGGVIYAKIYRDKNAAGATSKKPAVLIHSWRRIPARRASALLVLFSRTNVQQFAGAAGLRDSGYGLSRFRRLWTRLAYRHLPADGASGDAGFARRQEVAGRAGRGGSETRGPLRRLVRRLHDIDGFVPCAGGVCRGRGAASGDGLDAVRP